MKTINGLKWTCGFCLRFFVGSVFPIISFFSYNVSLRSQTSVRFVFTSSSLQGAHVLFTLFVVVCCLRIAICNTYCVVYFALFVFVLCLVYSMFPVSLDDCLFFFAPSVFSKVYFIFKCDSDSDLHIYKIEHIFVYYWAFSHLSIKIDTQICDGDYIEVLSNTTVNIYTNQLFLIWCIMGNPFKIKTVLRHFPMHHCLRYCYVRISQNAIFLMAQNGERIYCFVSSYIPFLHHLIFHAILN